MSSSKHARWLIQEIPGLVDRGILDALSAQKLAEHYKKYASQETAKRTAFKFLTAFGTLLIGLGIILLFAYNWDSFPRQVKLFVSFLPLGLASLISVVRFGQQKKSALEGEAIFQFLASGAALALVSQTYHLPGNFEGLMFSLSLLNLPVVYALQSSAAALLCLIGMTLWASAAQNAGGHAVFFWPLALVLAPFVWQRCFRAPASTGSVWFFWGMSLCLTVALGVSLEKVLPGLWIVIYSSFFACLYLFGVQLDRDEMETWQKPLKNFGGLAILVFNYLLTFKDFWKEIGFDYYRTEGRYHLWASAADYLLLIVFLCGAVILLVKTISRRKFFEGFIAGGAILSVLAYGFFARLGPLAPALLFNAFLFLQALSCVLAGFKERRLGLFNGGMLILAVLIGTRFMDASIGVLARASVFIFLGTLILLTNLFLSRKFSEENLS